MNKLPPSKEELELEKILRKATIKYGEIETKIKELQKSIKPSGPRPIGWVGSDQKNERIKYEIQELKKDQRKIVAATISKSEKLYNEASLETKERLMQRTDAWVKSDIAKKALEIESKTDKQLTEEQECFLKTLDPEKQNKTREEKIEKLQKLEKAVEFRDNKNEITSTAKEKKPSAEEERNRKIQELKKQFEKNKELYKGRSI